MKGAGQHRGEKKKDAERALAVAGAGDSTASENREQRRQMRLVAGLRG